jgi:hypothetical protein
VGRRGEHIALAFPRWPSAPAFSAADTVICLGGSGYCSRFGSKRCMAVMAAVIGKVAANPASAPVKILLIAPVPCSIFNPALGETQLERPTSFMLVQ